MSVRQVYIGRPSGHPASARPLEPLRVVAAPLAGFESAVVRVDGVPVPSQARWVGEAVGISGWCDTRGLPPGLHEVTAEARWSDGHVASASVLIEVAPGEPRLTWEPPAVRSLPAVARVSDLDLEQALARTALGGPPLILLEVDCELAEGARERVAWAFEGAQPPDVVIGDEAAPLGATRWMRWRKPAFQPEALPSIDQVGPLLAVGPRAADLLCDALPAGAGLYGLALELLDHRLVTLSVPHVLAITGEVRIPRDGEPERDAVRRLAARRGRTVEIGDGPVEGLRDVRWPLGEPRDVVAVIPSRTPAYVERCLAGLGERTEYPALSAIVVDSSGEPEAMARAVAGARPPATVVAYPAAEPFNYQRAVNLGAAAGAGADVLFVNDDVTPIAPDWLMRMAELLALPGVGIVGSMLLRPDGRIQHAGVGARPGEGLGHLYHDAPGDARGHRWELLVPGNPQAVTGACMLVRREVLDQIGGHDERYVHVYGDVDLCFRTVEAGWRIAWCPQARLEHAESATYGRAVDQEDIGRFEADWLRSQGAAMSNRVWS